MSKPFDMELFLAGILTGSFATRKRHIRQAKVIQTAIADRWKIPNPWNWRQKHLVWFVRHRMGTRSDATKYYYWLTIQLLVVKLGKKWFVRNGAYP
ncbi:hypothetical protein ACYSUW_19860 [Pseudomonas frederiksbergensis]|uniref:hypothetical protein n=1 Tax=unclassified Pseudomonas TaxID=196821 RepID=UPI0039B72A76